MMTSKYIAKNPVKAVSELELEADALVLKLIIFTVASTIKNVINLRYFI
jgi:hypothetical protein